MPDYPVITDSRDYQDIAASTTAALSGGGGGAKGDRLTVLVVTPSSLSPGSITVKDGTGSSITVFAGGANSLLTLHPFAIPMGCFSTSGAWSVTTGAGFSNVRAIGVFT
jgi:hypothetical protein